jgi:hypothetical protein
MMDNSETLWIVPLSNFVQRGFGFVHHSIAILYHEVPNPNITIRNFCIAVSRSAGARRLSCLSPKHAECVFPSVSLQVVGAAAARASRHTPPAPPWAAAAAARACPAVRLWSTAGESRPQPPQPVTVCMLAHSLRRTVEVKTAGFGPDCSELVQDSQGP